MEKSDFLVVGAGISGLLFALEAAKKGRVNILTKRELNEGNTRYAQGGIAVVSSSSDSAASHIEDTLTAGAGLCEPEAVKLIINESANLLNYLTKVGVQFDRDKARVLSLGREGGHSANRIVHAGDSTGLEIERALLSRAQSEPNIRFFSFETAIDLVTDSTSSTPRVIGLYSVHRPSSRITEFAAKITVLATGGAGKAYLYTTNPDVATGDGIAMAARAGAIIANMEFFQFHPTCLFHPIERSFLITEAMRGEGAILKTRSGDRFMGRFHEQQELAPRDIVARAIDQVMKETADDFVLLDISHEPADKIRSRFPMIYDRLLKVGIDITREPIPVVPAAHYCCGGIQTDQVGATSIDNLYCIGESAHTGLHGANRLASNSLLEGGVMGLRAAAACGERLSDIPNVTDVPRWDTVSSTKNEEQILISFFWNEIRHMMWNLVGIVRSDFRLELALRRIREIKRDVNDYYWRYSVTADLVELRNITEVAEIICLSALNRRESRGLHFNRDCPESESGVPKNTLVKLNDKGELEVASMEVRK